MKKQIKLDKLSVDFEENITHATDLVIAGCFLLGLDMGMVCKCSNREEGVKWFKRNFGHHDFLIKPIEELMKQEKKCSQCNNLGGIGDLFCPKCGTRFN